MLHSRVSDACVKQLASVASSFIYCVSVSGVTGQRSALSQDLPQFLARVRRETSLPLAVGFGISTREHVLEVAKAADGAVVGSKIIAAAEMPGVRTCADGSVCVCVSVSVCVCVCAHSTLLALCKCSLLPTPICFRDRCRCPHNRAACQSCI